MLISNTMRFGTDEFEFDVQPKITVSINDEDVAFICTTDKLSSPAIAFLHEGQVYYIYLVDPTDALASKVRIHINGTTYALAQETT